MTLMANGIAIAQDSEISGITGKHSQCDYEIEEQLPHASVPQAHQPYRRPFTTLDSDVYWTKHLFDRGSYAILVIG